MNINMRNLFMKIIDRTIYTFYDRKCITIFY